MQYTANGADAGRFISRTAFLQPFLTMVVELRDADEYTILSCPRGFSSKRPLSSVAGSGSLSVCCGPPVCTYYTNAAGSSPWGGDSSYIPFLLPPFFFAKLYSALASSDSPDIKDARPTTQRSVQKRVDEQTELRQGRRGEGRTAV